MSSTNFIWSLLEYFFPHIPGRSNGNEPDSRSFKIAARCCLKVKERGSAERAFSHFNLFQENSCKQNWFSEALES